MWEGLFVVLEGGEGCGKSSCLYFLREYFAKRTDVIFMREPGGTAYGEKIRRTLLSADEISVLAELFTFCALRANNCDLLIRPSLSEGKLVISDRFDASTVAYQIYGRNQQSFGEIFKQINAYAKGKDLYAFIEPDLTVFLDVDPEVGLKRVQSRLGEITRFDAENIEFHKKVREGYLSQANENKNWLKIDTTMMEIGRVQEEVLGAILNLMKKKGMD